ncbi:MAG: polysaccharide deacetylase, partial [Mesorhizobium sp.]
MTSDQIWQPLVEELACRQRADRKAEFWLRDDDAVDPTPALDRLLDLTGEFAVPVTLAVIPALTDEKLVARLDEAPHATVAIHGWTHRNHAPEDQKKQELGAHRPREVVLD